MDVSVDLCVVRAFVRVQISPNVVAGGGHDRDHQQHHDKAACTPFFRGSVSILQQFSHGYFTSISFWIPCSAPPKARASATFARLWAWSAEIRLSLALATDSCACITSMLSVTPAAKRSRACVSV